MVPPLMQHFGPGTSANGRLLALTCLVALNALGLRNTSLAADVQSYSVTKGILFTQTGGTPVLREGLPYVFQAVVLPPTNLITSARVQWSFADLVLTPIYTPNSLGFIQRLRTQDQLDATFPNGSYRILTQTVNDGSHTNNLTVSGNLYPAPPLVQNLGEAQSINAAANFSLTWNGFVGGTTSDFIFVQLENSQGRVFSSPLYPGAVLALDGTQTSVVIPANTLQPGRTYAGRIAFFKYSSLNTHDYPGVLGVGGYFTQTDFTVTTAGGGGGDVTPPQLVSTSPADGATAVPINAPVVFRFDETMSRGLALGISGTTASRTFDWSPDGRTLVATPTTNWPPNTTVVWTLNLFYTQQAFGDTNANPLPMETVLTFTTGNAATPNLAPVLSDQRRLPNGRFQFLVSGESNQSYVVQASTNLTLWTSLATNVAFTGQIEFLDTNAPAIPWRFYRAFSR
jgi:hypothetical protein